MAAAIPWGWDSPGHGGAAGLAIGAVVALTLALGLGLIGRRAELTVRLRDALVVVTLGWLSAGLLGAIPYVVTGAIPALHDAFFETISGFTTTPKSSTTV